MAALICSSDLPAATAFSIKASEMAELEPSFRRSSVKGTPSFLAISLTLSWLALSSAWEEVELAGAGVVAAKVGAGAAGAGAGAGTGAAWIEAAYGYLFLAITYYIRLYRLADGAGVAVARDKTGATAGAKVGATIAVEDKSSI